MILPLLIAILMLGGLLAWIGGIWNPQLPRWISLIAVMVNFIITVFLWLDPST